MAELLPPKTVTAMEANGGGLELPSKHPPFFAKLHLLLNRKGTKQTVCIVVLGTGSVFMDHPSIS